MNTLFYKLRLLLLGSLLMLGGCAHYYEDPAYYSGYYENYYGSQYRSQHYCDWRYYDCSNYDNSYGYYDDYG
ncbi:MAG: hypothetical protein AAF512_03405, partial [Pseudomonadota bacterium]